MNDTPTASVQIPKDVLEPIIKAHMQAALAEALGDRGRLLDKMAWQILNAPVEANGAPHTNASYNRPAGTWLEVNLRLAFQKVMEEVVKEELEGHKDALRMHLRAEMKKANSPLVKALVEGMCNGVVTDGLRYRLTVLPPEK